MFMKKSIILTCALALCLTGCGTPVISLTEDENDQIVSYAAETLLKYNSKASHGLTYAQLPEETVAEEETAEESDAENDTTIDIDAAEQDSVHYAPDSSAVDMSQVLDLGGCSFEFVGVSSTDTLTEGDYFDMTAPSGYVYQVLTVRVANHGSSDAALDLRGQSAKFTYDLDGTSFKGVTTVLSDDLANLQTTIGAGDSLTAKIVSQVKSDNAVSEPESVILYCTVNDIKGYVTLE